MSDFEVRQNSPFPIEVEPQGASEVTVKGPGVDIVLCAHGARHLASLLIKAAEHLYCDGYIHGDESTMLIGPQPGDTAFREIT